MSLLGTRKWSIYCTFIIKINHKISINTKIQTKSINANIFVPLCFRRKTKCKKLVKSYLLFLFYLFICLCIYFVQYYPERKNSTMYLLLFQKGNIWYFFTKFV